MTVASDLNLLAQRHIAYPVLRYFHGNYREEALAPSLAALDEALTILEHGLLEHGVREGAWRPTRTAVNAVLGSLRPRAISTGDDAPPPPRLDRLAGRGLRTRDAVAFGSAIQVEKERRQLLLSMVEGEGWTWERLVENDDDEP